MRRSRRLLCCAVLLSLPLSAQIPIDGRVRDSDGVGLAGVRVELRPIVSSYEQGLRELDGLAIEPAARTVTDKDGRFALLAPGEGMWEVGFQAEGFVPRTVPLAPLTAAESLFPVELRRDAGLRVRVEGPDGRPLAGARVAGRVWRRPEGVWQAVHRIALTGADGVARIPCSRDEMLTLFATAPGFPVQEGPEARGPAEVTFRLAAGAPHRIEAPDGAILRDLRTSMVLGRSGGEVVTKGESWLLLETAEGIRVRFAVPAKEGPVRVEVPASALLPGRVIDTSARQPLAGAWVWPRDDPGRFVRTDERGEYRMELAGRSLDVGLEAAAAGHLPEILDSDLDWQPGSIPPVALDPELILAGTVVDEEGKAATGAEVVLFDEDQTWITVGGLGPLERSRRVGRVSAGGEVRISGLRSAIGHDLVVLGPGFAPAWRRMAPFQGRENRFHLTLSRGGSAAGRIVDGQGRPVAGAEVAIEGAFEMIGSPLREPLVRTVTGPDGRFAFADLLAGRYGMTGRRADSVDRILPRFEVRESGSADLGDLRLDEGEVLAGRVVDPEGRPVAGAEVWAGEYEWEDWPAAVSGADGSFSLRASRWQPLSLTVCGPGFVPLGRSLPGFYPDEPLVLIAQPGAGIRGRVTGADGLPVSGEDLYVNLIGRDVSTPRACDNGGLSWSDGAGWFHLASLEPGLYDVTSLGRMTLAAGEVREVAVRTREWRVGASLAGRLLGRDGLPVPGAWIGVRARDDHGNYYVLDGKGSRTDAEGSYRLEFSRPGLVIDNSSYGISRHERVYVHSGFSEAWAGPKVVPAEGRHDITLDLYPEPLEAVAEAELRDPKRAPEPVSTITGRLLGLAPEELAQARVTAVPASGNDLWAAAAVDARGVYRLEGLERQAWRIRADAADRSLAETVHIPEGEALITRDLPFEPVATVYGRVETPGGEPVAGAVVRFLAEVERPVAEALSRSDGELEIRLPRVGFEATASREGFVPSPESPGDFVTPSDFMPEHTTLWLQPAAVLRGRLAGLPADADHVSIGATLVDGKPDYHPPVEGKLESEGRYVIPGLGPGTWEVEASYEVPVANKVSTRGRVVISGEATEARLDLAFSGR